MPLFQINYPEDYIATEIQFELQKGSFQLCVDDASERTPFAEAEVAGFQLSLWQRQSTMKLEVRLASVSASDTTETLADCFSRIVHPKPALEGERASSSHDRTRRYTPATVFPSFMDAVEAVDVDPELEKALHAGADLGGSTSALISSMSSRRAQLGSSTARRSIGSGAGSGAGAGAGAGAESGAAVRSSSGSHGASLGGHSSSSHLLSGSSETAGQSLLYLSYETHAMGVPVIQAGGRRQNRGGSDRLDGSDASLVLVMRPLEIVYSPSFVNRVRVALCCVGKGPVG